MCLLMQFRQNLLWNRNFCRNFFTVSEEWWFCCFISDGILSDLTNSSFRLFILHWSLSVNSHDRKDIGLWFLNLWCDRIYSWWGCAVSIWLKSDRILVDAVGNWNKMLLKISRLLIINSGIKVFFSWWNYGWILQSDMFGQFF